MKGLEQIETVTVIQAELKDRREADRCEADATPTYVWVSLNERFQASMQDQSSGGLAVLAPIEGVFEIGFQIRVEVSPNRYRMAHIVYAVDHDDTRVRLGLAWEDAGEY